MGALAAVSLLAKHEQEPPSTEQPFSEYSGGEEQGRGGLMSYTGYLCCFNSPKNVNIDR